MTFLKTLLTGAAIISATINGLFAPTPSLPSPTPSPTPIEKLGATIPVPVASFTTSLASKITSTDTSMTLVSTTTDDGTALTNGSVYGFVLDVGTADEEYVVGTASSSNIINMTRGISAITGNTSIAALKKEHRRGASVKIADAPVLLVMARILNGDETIPNRLSYDNPKTFTASSSIVDKNYVDSVATSGAPDALIGTKGIIDLSNKSQLAAGTDTGITSASLVPKNSYFNATSSATTTVPVTGINGKLSQGFLDLTESFAFTGTTTFGGQFTPPTAVSSTRTFGGNGSDGALSLTSGTTTVDMGGVREYVKNYSSISITGTGVLQFTNAHASGTVIVLKSQGNVTITCTSTPCINANGLGPQGGTFASSTASSTKGLAGFNTFSTEDGYVDGGYGGSYANEQAAGTSSLAKAFSTSTYYRIVRAQMGSGGGGGGRATSGTGTSQGGAGGRGGTILIIEAGGLLNFTTTNGIGVQGSNGSAGGTQANGPGGGGGGGGAGGMCVILYNSLTASSGTCNVTGGTGGNGADAAGAGGTNGGGGGAGGSNRYKGGAGGAGGATGIGASGSNGSGSSGGTGGSGGAAGGSSGGGGGGGGASGDSIIEKNQWWF